jgi:eukaryotic-like serine/threonine-protein kinase
VTLSAGACLGPYEIRQAIGAGGMGEVYRAWDRRLDRDVAIKVLPARLGEDPAALLRFEREAQAIAALSHPNVVAIHDVGEHEGGAYVITEFLDGMTLRARLQQGPLSLEQTLGYARQIAAGLEAAHAKGIVHRDIKPENLFVTRKGVVKILDFGLARQTKPPAPEDATISLPTPPGSITGTIGYIAPEQVRGLSADARSDIFSFGCVLYEMLRGMPPFRRRTSVETLTAILREDPESLNGKVPASIASIVTRCLAKNPESRFNTAADLAFVLEALPDPVSSSRSGEPIARTRRGAVLSVAAVVVLLTIVTFAWKSSETYSRNAPSEAVAPLAPVFTHLTSDPGWEAQPSLSPDGRWFVYVSAVSGNADIYLRAVKGQRAINLTADSQDDDSQPAFSPDGDRIVFRSERDGGGLFVMGGTGEGVKRITDGGFHPSWSADGREVAYSTRGELTLGAVVKGELSAVNMATGRTRRIPTQRDAVQPAWSPNGLRIAFWSGMEGIWTVPATAEGEAVRLTDFLSWNPVWSHDGRHVYFVSGRSGSMNLWRIALDEASGEALGTPQPITVPSPHVADLSHAAASDRLIYSSYTMSRNIDRVAFDPERGVVLGEPMAVTRGTREWSSYAPSRDGQWIVGGREGNLFVVRPDGSGLRQVVLEVFPLGNASWESHEARRIAFNGSLTGDRAGIWTVELDGSDLRLDRSEVMHPVWSPDARRVAFHGHSGITETAGILDVTRPEGPDNPSMLPLLTAGGTSFDPWSWSPDGHRLAGHSLEFIANGMHPGIVIYTPETKAYEKLTHFGGRPSWSPDGRWIVFSDEDKLYVLDFRTRITRELLSLESDSLRSPTVSGDGEHIYFLRKNTAGDIWMVSFDTPGEKKGPIHDDA